MSGNVIPSVGGIVLCGGASQRMGESKAWLRFGGQRLLQRVVGVLAEVVSPVVVARAGQALPPLPMEVPLLYEPADRGPLQGLVVGMRWLQGRVHTVYASACDLPFLHSRHIQAVLDCLLCEPATSGDAGSPPALASVPIVEGRLHPLAAAYRLAALPTLENALLQDQLRLTDLFTQLPHRLMRDSDLPDIRALRNLNTPDDYQQALRETAEGTD